MARGDTDDKAAADALLAAHIHAAALGVHNGVGQIEAQPQPADLAGGGGLAAEPALEDGKRSGPGKQRRGRRASPMGALRGGRRGPGRELPASDGTDSPRQAGGAAGVRTGQLKPRLG